MNRSIALSLVILMISTSFTSAQFDIFTTDQPTGESFVINVDKIEPIVVPSSVLEERPIPVYAFIKGATLGSLLAGKESPQIAPLYGVPGIKTLDVRAADATSYKYVNNILHVKPRRRDYPEKDGFIDLGYLIIQLRRIEKEEDIPEEILLNLTARVRFDLETGYGFFGIEDLILRERIDEDEWRKKPDRFWGGTGYLRASRIKENSVTIQVYNTYFNRLPSVTLTPSDPVSSPLRYRGPTFLDFFRVKLLDIKVPEINAKVEVQKDGETKEKTFFEEMQVYPGSNWKIEEIRPGEKKGEGEVLFYNRNEGKRVSLEVKSKTPGEEETEKVTCKDDFKKLEDEELLELANLDAEDPEQLEVLAKRFLCTGINELTRIIEIAPDSEFAKEAYFLIGQSYRLLGNDELASESHSNLPRDDPIYGPELIEIEEQIESNVEAVPIIFRESEDSDEFFYLTLKEVNDITDEEKPEVFIKINSGKEELFNEFDKRQIRSGLKDDKGSFSILLEEVVDASRIRVRLDYEDEERDVEKIVLQLDRPEVIKLEKDDSIRLEVTKIDTKSIAVVSVLPGTGKAISESNFNVHIPIEKRLIKFSPEQIDKQINETRNLIKKLDNIITNLDNALSTWTAVCFGTYAFLTLKNVLAGPNLVKARDKVLNEIGVDVEGIGKIKEGGWNRFCEENSGFDKFYKNFDTCIYDNREKINEQISNFRDSYKKVDELMGGIKTIDLKTNPESYSKAVTDMHEDLIPENFNTLVNRRQITETEIADLHLLKLSADEDAYKERINELNEKGSKYLDAQNNYDNWLEDEWNKMDDKEKTIFKSSIGIKDEEQVKSFIFNSYLYETKTIEEKDIRFTEVDNIIYGEGGKASLMLNGKVILLEQYKNDNGEVITDSKKRTVYVHINSKGEKVLDEQGNEVYYASEDEIDFSGINLNYAEDAKAEFYENGRPYCIPIDDGNFVKVLEYFRDGSPKTLQEWNVGKDGLLCTNDDVLVNHQSWLYYQGGEDATERVSKLRQLENVINTAARCKLGDKFRGKFECSYDRARLDQQLITPHCTDFMSISDCQVLFNVCDPVMCPASRFNFGGRWQLGQGRSVVETGIIGSLVLGLPNWALFDSKSPNLLPPVCMTGISAGLKSWRSTFQGYNECLQVSKIEGTNVGICDKIKSIFTCELLWREGVGVLKVAGSLIGIETAFGKSTGGGEYHPASFATNMKNAADSARFFTREYARNTFAAYEARSTSEIGTEICKAAFFGKGPGIDRFFDQLTAPESPPQFVAYFDEFPWTTSAGITRAGVEQQIISSAETQSRYQVYYHIYAGEDTRIQYSVFLTDSPYPNQIGRKIVYVTDCPNYGRRRAFIEKGDYADKTCDLIAESGLSQICVEINGRLECGFGKASTSFGLQKLQDSFVAGDVKKEINTEEECTPSARVGPSLTSGVYEGIYGATRTGMVRICGINDPDEGSNENNWERVGSCGQDEQGRSLGLCWLDKRTIGIKDILTSEKVFDDLTERGISLPDVPLTDEEANNLLNELNAWFEPIFGRTLDKNTLSQNEEYLINKPLPKELLEDSSVKLSEFNEESYRFLAENALNLDTRLNAQVKIGSIYYRMGEWFKSRENYLKQQKELTVIEEEFSIDKLSAFIGLGKILKLTDPLMGSKSRVEYEEENLAIGQLQSFLNQQGYNLKVNGIYGLNTRSAVGSFQKEVFSPELIVNVKITLGEVNLKTLQKIEEIFSQAKPTELGCCVVTETQILPSGPSYLTLDTSCYSQKETCDEKGAIWVSDGVCRNNKCVILTEEEKIETEEKILQLDENKVICEIRYDDRTWIKKDVFYTFQNNKWWWKKGGEGTYKILEEKGKEEVGDVHPSIFGQLLNLKENLYELGIQILVDTANSEDTKYDRLIVTYDNGEQTYEVPHGKIDLDAVKSICEVTEEQNLEQQSSESVNLPLAEEGKFFTFADVINKDYDKIKNFNPDISDEQLNTIFLAFSGLVGFYGEPFFDIVSRVPFHVIEEAPYGGRSLFSGIGYPEFPGHIYIVRNRIILGLGDDLASSLSHEISHLASSNNKLQINKDLANEFYIQLKESDPDNPIVVKTTGSLGITEKGINSTGRTLTSEDKKTIIASELYANVAAQIYFYKALGDEERINFIPQSILDDFRGIIKEEYLILET